ncbi:MAG: S8 family serine peptidase [Gammaproteobacteria bacterium]|nr:S8 family serine peptidase [Gammaproteobacteria bacterium]
MRLPDDARRLSPVADDEIIELTLVLRRKPRALPSPAGWPYADGAPLNRETFGDTFGADAADVERVQAFARASGLTVTACEPRRRVLWLSGPAQAVQRAFGVELGYYEWPGRAARFRGCRGEVTLPPAVCPAVLAVLGMDQRPLARPHFRRARQERPPGGFTPPELARLYAFPDGLDGSGQVIGILELGGGYRPEDLQAYFGSLGLPAPGVVAVSVDGGANRPGGDADGEVMLDIEVAGALAPGAGIVVYFAPNTDRGFHDAISQAAHDTVHRPSILSISWGAPENAWNAMARSAVDAALEDAAGVGVTVPIAAGDNGSSDGESDGVPHVDFPASSAFALACGGTRLTAAAGAIAGEVVWNELANGEGATGGGVSAVFARPGYQSGIRLPESPQTPLAGRGVPDVAADADPETGYRVRVDGRDLIIGGTSAVAPLWAGLVARLNQKLGRPLGHVNAVLYRMGESAFRDIVSGNNGAFRAAAGWDACTGLGSPDGAMLLQALTAAGRTPAGVGKSGGRVSAAGGRRRRGS